MPIRPSFPTLALSLLLASPGAAFALTGHDLSFNLEGPATSLPISSERQFDIGNANQAWKRYTAANGDGWQVTWNEQTGLPSQIYGEGIDLGSTNNPQALEEAALGFLDSHRDLLGVNVATLNVVASKQFEHLYLLSFEQTLGGLPILGAQVDMIFNNGRLVSMGFGVHSDTELSLDVRPNLGKLEALAVARHTLPVPGHSQVSHPGDLVVVPMLGEQATDGVLSFHLAWRSTLKTTTPNVGEWQSLVDAHTGELLWVHNTVKFASGSVMVDYEGRLPGDDLLTAPSAYAEVVADRSSSSETDMDGLYDSGTSGGSVSTYIRGSFVSVYSRRKQASASFDNGDDFTWGFEQDASAAELDSFMGTNIVRDRALAITPNLQALQDNIKVNTNLFGTCNAYYNGQLNFLNESPFCNNTGRIQDVIYHEYGHFYHAHLVIAGTVNGTIGEGSGDYLSATITGDPLIGPTFVKTDDGDGEVRNIEPDLVYPDDLDGTVHGDGRIWSGAMWDLRKLLIQRYGDDEGIATADHLFAFALTQGPRLETCYAAVLTADDDDGDLSNGTPNQAFIDIAFGAHGLIL